jgi:hypothetical protein
MSEFDVANGVNERRTTESRPPGCFWVCGNEAPGRCPDRPTKSAATSRRRFVGWPMLANSEPLPFEGRFDQRRRSHSEREQK